MTLTADKQLLRLVLTTSIPSPYQVDLFDALARRNDVRLEVLYWRLRTTHLFELRPGTGHRWRVLKGFPLRLPFAGTDVLCPGIVREVLRRDYDLFIVSGLGPTSVAAILLLCVTRSPWAFWGERLNPWVGGRLKLWAKRFWWRFVCRTARGMMCIGKLAVREYTALGAPAHRAMNVPYCPDLSPLLDPDDNALRRAQATRDRLGYDARRVVFLFAGILCERKGVDKLIEAFRLCAEACPNGRLLILGDGPGRDEYERLVPPDLRPMVHFAGFVQGPELYDYYLAADVFAFPSRHDGWGVVVGEAAAAGLPLLVSDNTGAHLDLVLEGETGYVFRVNDAQGLADRMTTLAADKDLRQRLGRAARETARNYTAEAGAEKLVRAARSILGRE